MDKSETERPWSDLSWDILRLILSRLLFIGDRYAFKSVCKSWNSIDCGVRIPLSLPPSDDSPYYDSPCLAIPHENNDHWEMFHSVHNDFYYLDFPELRGAEIRYCKFEWLLLSRDDDLFFFNPFTKMKMEVTPIDPTPNSPPTFISVCFNMPPTSKYCLVFGVYPSDSIHLIECCILPFGMGDSIWYRSAWNNPIRNNISSCPPLFTNGAVYFMDKFGNLSIMYVVLGYVWADDTCPTPEVAEQVRECYLVEVGRDICGVFILSNDRQVLVMKLVESQDGKNKYWEPMESLGNKCLYVAPNGSFAETNSGRGMANTIYFYRLHGKSGVLYSLTTAKFHSINCDFIETQCSELIETNSNCFWIKPPKLAPWKIDNTVYSWHLFL